MRRISTDTDSITGIRAVRTGPGAPRSGFSLVESPGDDDDDDGLSLACNSRAASARSGISSIPSSAANDYGIGGGFSVSSYSASRRSWRGSVSSSRRGGGGGSRRGVSGERRSGSSHHARDRDRREGRTAIPGIVSGTMASSESSLAADNRRGIGSRGASMDEPAVDGAAAAPLDPSLRVMSVVVEGSKISFCCYDEDRNEITMETSTATGYETEALVERFLQVTRPNMMLLGNRIVNNVPLFDMLTRRPSSLVGNKEAGDEAGASRISSTIPYRLLKSRTFNVRKCEALILQKLKVLSMLKHNESHGSASGSRYNYNYDSDRCFPQISAHGDTMYLPSSFNHLAAVIDFDSKVLIQALGALLSYLQSTVFELEDGKCVVINRIVHANISSCVSISPSTFSALHIFSTEHHPLIAKGHGRSKEGFSLFSLLDRTKTQGGRQLLREWMLKPLTDLECVNTRQDATELFLHPSMQTTVGVLLDLLRKVGPMDKILLKIQKCVVRPQDYLVVTTSLSAAISIANVIGIQILSIIEGYTGVPLASKFFSRLHLQCNVKTLIDLREYLVTVIDIEVLTEDKESLRVIRHGFHEQLDTWKEQYDHLDDTLSAVATDLYRKYHQLDGLSVVFIPQIGYLVELDVNLVFHAQVELPEDFERIFNQDGFVYFKCFEMRYLDEDIGDLDAIIRDTERMILTELEEKILDAEHELRECFKALSTLDCILSFANCAADLNFVRPQLIGEDDTVSLQSQDPRDDQPDQQRRQLIYIKGGRHPLQEIICEREFVKNDIHIDDRNLILCITGPNYSGKSCYMRQVGVLVYMAHLGCFIPCSEATISVTDQIFVRVSAMETCSRPQSSYQLELTEMASILLKATPKSLVLIDEFGKGTAPASGIAVLGAALKKLSKIRCKTVCTTHFLELFTMNVITDQQHGFRARQMAIHLPEGKADEAVPLFKLKDGVASSSAGLICAKAAGVDNTVIDRAKEIIRTLRAKKVIQPVPDLEKQIPIVSRAEKELLKYFVSIDSWENSSDEEIEELLQLLSKLSPHN